MSPTVHFSSLPCEVCHWPTSGNLRGPSEDPLRVCDDCAALIDTGRPLYPGTPETAVRTANAGRAPLLRPDTEIRRIAGELWGLWTRSAGTGPLYHGSHRAVLRLLAELAPPCEKCNRRPGILKVRAYGYVSDFCLEDGLELLAHHDGTLLAVAVRPSDLSREVLGELHPELPPAVLDELVAARAAEEVGR